MGVLFMLKEICGIELCGANFENPTRLDMFNPIDGGTQKTIKGTLLYGRNGSGKSTIARGFRKIIGEKDQPINYASVLDKNGSPIVLTESEKKKIFIFDEDYVDKNVKLQEDHLDTIVMLGKQADLTEQIAKAEIDCEIARAEADKQQKIYVAYQDHTNEKSPKYYINQLRFALQGDDNWAGRDKVVRNGRQNSPVRDDTYEQFLRAKPTKSRDELVVDFANGVNELKTAREGRTNINPPAPNIPDDFSMYDDTEVRNNLFKKIERPILSDRERYLLQLVQRGKSPDLIAQKAHLEREDGIKEIIDMVRQIIPYNRMLISSDGYLIPLDDRYFRIDAQNLGFKYGGEITCVGMITNIIGEDTDPNDSQNIFATLQFSVNEVLRQLLPTKERNLCVIHPIAVYYGN